ncbi:MAG TPA: carboxypeptidase-like regulatory domain-containing protein [Bryobacteraceae bacterium]
MSRLPNFRAAVLLAALTFAIFVAVPTAWGQAVAVAEVSGTVTDSSGGAVPTAQVIMTETSKQLSRTTLTDPSGHYVLTNLPVGPYSLEVKASGFKNYVQTGLELQANNNIQINVTMQVGAVSERVEVMATASMVETKENSIAVTIDSTRISELPLNGRQPTQLILSLGAASYGDAGDTGSKTYFSSTRISVAGGQSNGTAYLLDGGDNTDAMSNVNLPFPFPDAIQEFSVETSAVSPRFGIHPGATVNVVTEIGVELVPREPVRVPAQWRCKRPQLFRPGARQPEAQSMGRHRGRQDHQGQAVLLRRLSGHAQPVDAAAVDHSHPYRGFAHQRLQYAGVGSMPIERKAAYALQP